jgi:26S proteasome regulatory subunit N1
MVLASAYLGTGNVVKSSNYLIVVQELFNLCSETGDEKAQEHKGLAVLGMAMIAMQDQIGSEMLLRSLNHILQFGDLVSKRAVNNKLIHNLKGPIGDCHTQCLRPQNYFIRYFG